MAEKREPKEKQPKSAPVEAPAAETRETAARRYRVAASVSRRYRAGLGPFGPAPVEVELSAEQLQAIEADPYLTVTPVDG